MALSQAYGPASGRKNPFWSCAETLAPPLLKALLAEGIGRGTLLNINFPDCPAEQVVGTVVTTQGLRDSNLVRIDERQDTRGNPYFWIAFERGGFTPGEGTDLEALARKMISVTPLRLDLTHHAEMSRYTRALA